MSSTNMDGRNRAISPEGFLPLNLHPQWLEYRAKLEKAVLEVPQLRLTISSSATLVKDEQILIDPLGLVSHKS